MSEQDRIAKAIEQLKELRDMELPIEERKLRLAELKEHFRLLGLYEQAAKNETENDDDDVSSEELAEVRKHLEPLELAPTGTPAGELARLAALKITNQ